MLSWDEVPFVEGFLQALLADGLFEPLDAEAFRVRVQGQQDAEDRVCVGHAAVLVVVRLPAYAVGQRKPAQGEVTSIVKSVCEGSSFRQVILGLRGL